MDNCNSGQYISLGYFKAESYRCKTPFKKTDLIQKSHVDVGKSQIWTTFKTVTVKYNNFKNIVTGEKIAFSPQERKQWFWFHLPVKCEEQNFRNYRDH